MTTISAAEIPSALVLPRAPLLFHVSSCRFVAAIPGGVSHYWAADVIARRHGEDDQPFSGILFVQHPGKLVFLAGIESEDGIDPYLRPEVSARQAQFLNFLHDQEQSDTAALGALAGVFKERGYAAIARLADAFCVANGLHEDVGVGFFNPDGQYRTVRIERDSGARS